MAGRSGAAAIEVALREAAASFDAHALANKLRGSAMPDGAALASALEPLHGQKPVLQQREGELYLEYAAVPDSVTLKRADVSTLAASGGHGVELLLNGTSVVGVSIYLE